MALLQFDELIDEVNDRGFDHLTDARIGRYVNETYQNLCSAGEWKWLETTDAGAPPLTLTYEPRGILSVVDTTNEDLLEYRDRRDLLRIDTDLTTTGTPRYWYQDDTPKEIKVYPANTGISISVTYRLIPALLTGSNTPITNFPERWQHLIVDGAVIKAYKDADNFDKAVNLQGFFDLGLEKMRQEELRNYDGPEYIVQTQTYEVGGW